MALAGKNRRAPCGVYVHIPFCERKCAYCSFHSRPPKSAGELDIYVAELAHEIRQLSLRADTTTPIRKTLSSLRGAEGKPAASGCEAETAQAPINGKHCEERGEPDASGREVDSIHIGGGTPSLLSATNLQKLASAFSDAGLPLGSVETAFEANPNSLTEAKIEKLREIGVSRLSLGAQSFNPRELKTLGRLHSVSDIHAAVYAARKYGFANLSLDLIFGIPGQDFASAESDIAEAISLAPEHISYYSLELEEGTPLATRISSGELSLPSDSLNRKIYRRAALEFAKAGYTHYEISNFAKPGYESKHNLKYWTGAEYIGIGDGAHSYLFCDRRRGGDGGDGAADFSQRIVNGEVTQLSLEDDMKEYIIMALRKISGLNLSDFAARYGFDFLAAKDEEVRSLEERGLLVVTLPPEAREGEGRVALTEKGLDFANEVFREFL